MIFLDSGFLIALAKPRDSLHAQARAWANQVREPLVVTEYVLCETVDALSLPTDREKAHLLLAMLRARPHCQIIAASSGLFEAGVKLHATRTDKEWSLTDCISFQVMREMGIQRALAYDLHFSQAGFEPLLRREPPL
jgi:predicted nucleic acid-binding protein